MLQEYVRKMAFVSTFSRTHLVIFAMRRLYPMHLSIHGRSQTGWDQEIALLSRAVGGKKYVWS